MSGNFEITVQGQIQIIGTQNDSVYVHSSEQEGINWSGIRLENEAIPSSIDYCRISNAENAVHSINSPCTVTHSTMVNNEKAVNIYSGNSIEDSSVSVDSCLIKNCLQNGIYILENSETIIRNSEITACALDQSPRGAIMLSSQGGECNPLIENCFIHGNVWQGISAWDITGGNNRRIIIFTENLKYDKCRE